MNKTELVKFLKPTTEKLLVLCILCLIILGGYFISNYFNFVFGVEVFFLFLWVLVVFNMHSLSSSFFYIILLIIIDFLFLYLIACIMTYLYSRIFKKTEKKANKKQENE